MAVFSAYHPFCYPAPPGPVLRLRMGQHAKHAHLYRKGDTLYAYLEIPAALRTHFGKKRFKRTTKTLDRAKAAPLALALAEVWRREIEAVRSGLPVRTAEEIARDYFAAQGIEREERRLFEIGEFLAAREAGLLSDDWHEALVQNTVGLRASLRAVGGEKAVVALDHMTTTHTPFLGDDGALVKAFADSPGANYQYQLTAKLFARLIPDATIETFNSDHMQSFINKRQALANADGSPLSRKTLDRDKSGLRSYWSFLLQHNPVLKKRDDPFQGVIMPKPTRRKWDPTAADFDANARVGRCEQRFTLLQICDLWDAAHQVGNEDLYDLVVLCAYTGGRRNGAFTVHRETVYLDKPVPYIRLNEKTEAGWRGVPIHPDIYPILGSGPINLLERRGLA